MIKEFSYKKFHSIIKNEKYVVYFILFLLSAISIICFIYYYKNGLVWTYNDAKSHLNIGRRVVDGLRPGLAQLGSVWLPLLHLLMTLTIWNDFMWYSGLAGAIWSMFSFVGTGMLIYFYLKELNVGMGGRLLGVLLFAANLNIIYLQSTAMTESVLLFLLTAGAYYFLLWLKREKLYYLIATSFFIMLSTLVRYDGWFMLALVGFILAVYSWYKFGFKKAEGLTVLFFTFGGFGILIWFAWNYLIFGDPLYFIFGPYSAHAQQESFASAGLLQTKYNIWLSLYSYFLAMIYNVGILTLLLGVYSTVSFWIKKNDPRYKIAILVLFSPFFFNVIALFLGHSILFIPEYINDTWFNVRYGVMVLPAIVIMVACLVDRLKKAQIVIVLLIIFVIIISLLSNDSVVIEDGKVGISHKDISLISQALHEQAVNEKGYVLIAVAANDTIAFSAHLPMDQYIHEGTDRYFIEALNNPTKWARWIVMDEYNEYDLIWKTMNEKQEFKDCYYRYGKYPHASLFTIKDECFNNLILEPIYE